MDGLVSEDVVLVVSNASTATSQTRRTDDRSRSTRTLGTRAGETVMDILEDLIWLYFFVFAAVMCSLLQGFLF
jgi:hypothetical protein